MYKEEKEFNDKESAVDVPIRTGTWEERYVEDDPYDTYGLFRRRFYCSACGKWNCYGKTDYCMHCGAKMEVAG